jgi:hypothetical protein
MKTSGLELEPRTYRGTVTPPLTWEDASRYGHDGAFTNAPTWTLLPSGLWVLDFISGSSQLVNFGDCDIARTLLFWISPDSTTESILEELAATGVSINAGSMVYGSWDNCFVDAVDTDTIAIGWHFVAITSTTDVTVSAFRVGLVNVTYLDGSIWCPRLFRYELNAGQINKMFEAEKHWFGV